MVQLDRACPDMAARLTQRSGRLGAVVIDLPALLWVESKVSTFLQTSLPAPFRYHQNANNSGNYRQIATHYQQIMGSYMVYQYKESS